MQTTIDKRKIETREMLEKAFPKKQAEVLADVITDAYNDLVKTSDFNELKAIVKELAEAHKQSEKRLTKLEEKVAELAEAQKKTEKRVEELAEAQKETQKELKELVKEHKKTRVMVGGLSDTLGYGLEDKIMPYMFNFGKKEYAVEVKVVDRRNIIYPDGRYDEINIYIEGEKDGEKVYLAGECKARPSKKEIDGFAKVVNRVKAYLKADVYPFIVGYYYAPDVERYLMEHHPEIRVFKSFEFEMRYRG